MRILFTTLICLFGLFACKSETQKEIYLFSYFKGNGDGLHLAYSTDGLTWNKLNNDSIYLKPEIGKDKLMRDPSIVQDDNGMFHMVWTSGWWDQGIGYASSADLTHWSEQKNIPVMEEIAGAKNAWAPELFFDEETKTFYIFWASTVPGMFNEIATSEREKGLNHRQFYTTTKDFNTFSKTQVFFNPEFSVIDGSIIKQNDRFYLFVKNENSAPAEKNIRVTSTDELPNFSTDVSNPITGDYWAEGPTALQIGEHTYVYFDKYRDKQYGAVRSSNMKNWEDISHLISFPSGIRHGTAFKISNSTFSRLTHQ
ncbi:MAG: glycoside hydrolase family 43 protein [Mangrovibacterium sp.]